MIRRLALILAITLVTALLMVVPVAADSSIPVVDTTVTVKETGAIHIRLVQTIPDNPEGVTNYQFNLVKQYRPENVSVYDYATGQPLKFGTSETDSTINYDAYFDRPYYHGYQLVVEYDCHNLIIYEGSGVYSLSMRPAVDTRVIDQTYTIILPPANFTYLGYNRAFDTPVSVTDVDGSKQIMFHNLSSAGADYAWEIDFRAIGIDSEVFKIKAETYKVPVPGMSSIAALVALLMSAMAWKLTGR